MKTLKKAAMALWPAIAMTVLILDPKTALQGAGEGIDLCVQSVIPSLFPFIFLSGFITRTLLSEPIPLLQPIGQLCKIPYGCEGLLAVGLVGGYPVGAQCIAHAYGSGQLSKTEGRRMLGFCSNAGPSFIFGILGPLFSDRSAVWILWVIQIISALMTGILLPGDRTTTHSSRKTETRTNVDPLKQSVGAMAAICGWIILFRVVLSFLERWFLWMLPTEAAILLSGILELTNGCCELTFVTSEATRFLLASPLLAFGGVCVWLQTISVTQELGTGAYLTGKLIQTGISTLLACLILPLRYSEIPPFPFLLIPVTAGIILLLSKNLFKVTVAFSRTRVYNDKKERIEVISMLFRKNIEHHCAYCKFGTAIEDDKILCVKKGVVSAEKPCWKFQYDPCKRIPAKPKALDFKKYDDEDFSL